MKFLFPCTAVVDFLVVDGGLFLQAVFHAAQAVKHFAHFCAHGLAVVVFASLGGTLQLAQSVSGLLQFGDVAFDFGSRVIRDGVRQFRAQGGDGVLHALALFCIILFHFSKIFGYRFKFIVGLSVARSVRGYAHMVAGLRATIASLRG